MPLERLFLVLHLFGELLYRLLYINLPFYKNCVLFIKLIQGVLINGICLFDVGGAGRRPHRAPSLTKSTSDCAVWLRSGRIKRSGIMREMSLLCACRVLPPAEQFRGFPQTKCRGGTEWGKHREEGGKQHLEFYIYSEISWLCRFFRFILLNLTCKNQG